MERLIVSGSVDRTKERDERTPIGWVLDRLQLGEELDRADAVGPSRSSAGRPGVVLRIDRYAARAGGRARDATQTRAGEASQLVLFEGAGEDVPAPHHAFASSSRSMHRRPRRVARLSYSAISLYDRCGYRYYAERIVGMKPVPWGRDAEARRRRAASDRDR